MEEQNAQNKIKPTDGGTQPPTNAGPENSNQINVSLKKNPNFYVFLGKRYLEIHETVELHALGNAVCTSVIASENLVRNQYATFKSIRTMTIPVSSKTAPPSSKTESSRKAKLLITLQRGPDFFENMRKFQEIKEENERLAAKAAAEKEAAKASDKDEKPAE